MKPAKRAGSPREMREPMAKYKIVAMYEHEGIVSGDNEQQAEKNFLANLNQFYFSTESYEIEKVCENCENELDLDGSCFECREDEEEN